MSASGNGGLGHALGDARSRVRQPRADREQLLLDRFDLRGQIGIDARRADGPEIRVQLVHLAVGIHTVVGLRHTGVVEQRRLSRIAGLGVDPHA